MLLLHTNWSNVPHLLRCYCHASVLLSMVSIKVKCMVTLQMDKRYYALYDDRCMDSQSHSIKDIGTMHSMTGTWILNLTPSKVEVLCTLQRLVHGSSISPSSQVEVLCTLRLVHGFSISPSWYVEVQCTLQRLVHGSSISPSSQVEVLCTLQWLIHGFSISPSSQVEVLWTLQWLVVLHGFSISPHHRCSAEPGNYNVTWTSTWDEVNDTQIFS